MNTQRAHAEWEGGLRVGSGSFRSGSGILGGGFTLRTRVGDELGSNPEELVAAALACSFVMELAAQLERAGAPARRLDATAECAVVVAPDGSGPVGLSIVALRLRVRGEVPGLDEPGFQSAGELARQVCAVTRALAAVPIEVDAELVVEGRRAGEARAA